MAEKEKKQPNEAQKQLDNYRNTGRIFFNPDDEEFMDFSKVDDESKIKKDDKDTTSEDS